MFIKLYKSSSAPLAFFLASFLLFFGAENGLASQQCYYQGLYYWVTGQPRENSVIVSKAFWMGNSSLSDYEKWPFLQSMKSYTESTWSYNVYYQYQYSFYGANKYPWCYTPDGIGSFTIPDDWTEDDFDNILVDTYNKLTPSQQAAVTSPICGTTTTSSGGKEKWVQFNHRTIGAASPSGGVYTYGPDGVPTVSYADNTGYASGYKRLPDGSFTPTYYTIDNGTITEYSDITLPSFDTLTYDSETGNYSLDIPNYSKHLDKIINKLDTINLDNVKLQIPAPEVTVNPTVTVPAPEVTVNVPETDLSDVEASLVEIGNTLVADDHTLNLQTNDLNLTSDEQLDLQALRTWQVDIPLLGDAVDFGLNSLIGKIPNVGTEYVWLDYTIGGSKRSSKAPSSNPLNGYHIRIDLTSYQQTLLAVRGWLILLEALFFSLLVYKNVREALTV